MVWLHGGGFTVGSGAAPSIRCRCISTPRSCGRHLELPTPLGALGFFAHPALSHESEGSVRELWAARSTRRSRVGPREYCGVWRQPGKRDAIRTVGGCDHSPFSSHRRSLTVCSIAQLPRAARCSVCGKPRLRVAEERGESAVADIKALRAMSAEEVLARLPSAPTLSAGPHYYPVIDEYVLPDDSDVLAGKVSRPGVPLLTGHNSDEGLFYASGTPPTVSEYRTSCAQRFQRNSSTLSSQDIRRDRRRSGSVHSDDVRRLQTRHHWCHYGACGLIAHGRVHVSAFARQSLEQIAVGRSRAHR